MAVQRGNRSCVVRSCLAMLFWAGVSTHVLGQQVELRYQEAPYYVGEPVVILIVVKGLDAQEEPSCRLVGDVPPDLEVSGPQMERGMRQFMQFRFGGRTVTQESVHYRFQFLARATKSGTYEVGPFEVRHEGTSQTVAGRTFTFQDLPDDPDMEIQVEFPQTRLFVGQRVPMTVSWWMAAPFHEVEYAFRKLEIRSPLFDQFEVVQTDPQTRTSLTFSTAEGPISVDATQSEEQRDGKEYVVLTSKVTMLASVVGDFADLPISCRTERGRNWVRVFGGVRPQRRELVRSTSLVPSFSVEALPQAGRPASFAGAVGSGFGFDVSANRSIVRVGDPISLTLALTGPGLAKMPLPSLRGEGGLNEAQFQLPSEPPVGSYDGRTKQFKLNVRVKYESVAQIPALAYSWFDPAVAEYRTTHSKPIALQVMPAQVLSAQDVVSAVQVPQDGPESSEPSEVLASAQGVNLAIEDDVARLQQSAGQLWESPWLGYVSYLGGTALVLLALLQGRRATSDSPQARARQQHRVWRQALVSAREQAGNEGLEQAAAALRKLAAASAGSQRQPLDRLVARCEEAIYAPHTAAGCREIVEEALPIVDQMEPGKNP